MYNINEILKKLCELVDLTQLTRLSVDQLYVKYSEA